MRKKTTSKKSKRSTAGLLLSPKRFSKKYMLIFAVIFGILGSYFVWNSLASTTAFATWEAEKMTSLPAGTISTSDSTASFIRMTAKGTATGVVQPPLDSTATHMSLKARATACTGTVQMIVRVAGKEVQRTSVISSTWAEQPQVPVDLAAGTSPVIEIDMVSDAYSQEAGKSGKIKCQRTLDIDKITFYSNTAEPPPPPVVVPTVDLRANPPSVAPGTASTLSWTSTDATSCTASGGWSGTKPVSGSESTAPLSTATAFSLTCTGPGGTITASANVAITSTSGGGGTVLFEDQFNAAAGAPADSTKWTHRGSSCEGFLGQAGSKDENTFHDGAGNLIIRTKRETGYVPVSGCATHYYSTDIISNFSYGYGWPATGVKASWPVPFRIELRAQYPALTGGWGGAWLMNTDRTQAQKLTEIDFSEMRTFNPAVYQAHQHVWYKGSTDTSVHDISAWDCTAPTPSTYNMTTGQHVYSADVYADRIVYKVDGITCGTRTELVLGSFGAILNFGIGDPNTWGSGYTSGPASSDPGPWDVKYDYLRVTAL